MALHCDLHQIAFIDCQTSWLPLVASTGQLAPLYCSLLPRKPIGSDGLLAIKALKASSNFATTPCCSRYASEEAGAPPAAGSFSAASCVGYPAVTVYACSQTPLIRRSTPKDGSITEGVNLTTLVFVFLFSSMHISFLSS
jgi:hypothetical protein